MSCLIDTNILLRIVQNDHPMNEAAVQSVKIPFERGETLYIAPQNLIEFWVVATRPIAVNGLGLSIAQGLEEIEEIKNTFTLLFDTEDIFLIWENLIASYKIIGKLAHDTRLVAIMIANNLTDLLTFNASDFKKYTEINTFTPNHLIHSTTTD